eukprot:TRINITY_DN7645_c0_g1_i2.p1 TRINITY_DN7645_c0_g1~~TRINITY_DN7645_c0_g1_i2.p1  ORF type:complete len:943 (-),score=274.23 TRINITY_DN7645_c0_g1_i2:72-2900(-)
MGDYCCFVMMTKQICLCLILLLLLGQQCLATDARKITVVREGESLVELMRNQIKAKCPTSPKVHLHVYRSNGCIDDATWKKWKVYVKSGKAPKYVTYARLFLGSSAIQTLRSVSFQVSRLLDAAEAKNEFIRVIGDKVLQKLRNLRIRKSFQGLLGLKGLGLIIGRKAVELLLEYNLIYASPSEKRVYANWIAYVRWRLLRPIIGLSNVKTLEDWRKVRGSSILYGLRFLRPFSYFFSRKSISRVNIALARKALLRFQLKDYDKKVEALVGYWKQIYGKDNKYNTEAGQSLWNVLVSLGRNFVGHRVVAAVRKLGRVDPLQFYHMRMSLFQYPRGRLLKYWRVLYKRGGVFSWAFLRKLKKVIFSKNNRAKAIGRFLAFRRKLRPFVGYVFNARFRYIARLYSRSRFAIDLLKEGLYVTPRRLTRVHNEFVRRICLRRNLGPNTARRLVPLVLHRLRHTFSYRVYNHVFNHVVREGEAVRALISKEINKRGLTLDIDAFLTYGKNLETRFGVYKGLRLFNIIMPAFSRTPSGYRLLVDPARIVRFNQLIGLKPEDHRFTSVEVTAIRGRYLKSYAKAGEGSWPSFFARFFSDTIVFRDRKGRIFDDVALQAEEAALFAKFGLRSGQTQFEMFRKSLQPVHVHVLRATARRWVTAYRILIQFNSNPRVLASKTTYTDTEMTSIRNRLVGRAGFEQGNHQFLMFKSLFYRVYSLRLQAAVARRLITSPVEAITKLIQRYNSDIPKEKVEQIRKRLMAKHGERSKKSVDRYIGRNLVELPAFILKPHWQNTVLPALNQVRGLASFVQRSKGILHESQLHRIENVIREKYDPSTAAQKISLLRSNLIETAVYRMRSRVVLAKVQKHPEFQRLVEMESSKKTRKMLRRLSSRLRDDLHGRLGSEDAEFFLQENERQIGLLFKSISRIVSNNVRAHLATDSLSRISDP